MKVVYDFKKEIGILRIDSREEFDELERTMDNAKSMSGRGYPTRVRNEIIGLKYNNKKNETK